METEDGRLVEDVLPIATINEVAQREKIGHTANHPRKLHLWWARRPLAAARAAVYATLVPEAEARRTPEEAEAFFRDLCRWGGPESVIAQARQEVLDAHCGVPPKVLDMFAGGGAIPLEAARLGCEATAVELNPVASLIERCMLEYPQTFPGLADDLRRWGKVWVDRAWEQLADLYPPVLDGRRPLAYLWTRTVRCPNPSAPEHRVPLVRQTWLARKPGRSVALRTVPDRASMTVGYGVVWAQSPSDLGFDPAAGSKRGSATCPLCGAHVTAAHVKAEGVAGRLGTTPLAAVVLKASGRGRDYLAGGLYSLSDDGECEHRLRELDIDPPEELLVTDDTLNIKVPLYGLRRFRDLFTPRQLLTLCTLTAGVRPLRDEMLAVGVDRYRADAIATYLGLTLSRVSDRTCAIAAWDPVNETAGHAFAQQSLSMNWDFVESSPFGGAAGDLSANLETTARIVDSLAGLTRGCVIRGSAVAVPIENESQDAVITDPPYEDNISYADLSDYFYVWLKRSIGFLYPDDFGGELTPKRSEAIVAPYRFGGDRGEARNFYRETMAKAFAEANRVLKPGAPLICVYAHKSTLGWSTLIQSLGDAGFAVTESWPLDTEMPERSGGQGTASLASSIFLVARKRQSGVGVGREADVMEELDGIVRERLDRFKRFDITGPDLVVATVGAGLRAFTRFERVEQDNGDLLPAIDFLALVQGRVLDAIFGSLRGADSTTRFYVAAQYSYGYAFVDFGEANTLGWTTGVEVDGSRGLTVGRQPLLRKKKSAVALRDFEERGNDLALGLADPVTGAPPPLIDVVHGVLWRAEHRPNELREYLAAARPDADLLRSVVQALAGEALRSGTGDVKAREPAAAERLLGSWRHLVDAKVLAA